MSKYIIDTDQFEKLFETKAVAVLGIGDNLAVPEEGEKTVWTRMINVADLEELNSDYINEHFGELQDTAYQKGINDGSLDVKQRVEGAYQRGLDDAWECARKLFSSMADSDIEKAFPVEWNNGGFNALINLQPQEAIAKLKAYEEKQDNKFEFGDEITNSYGTKGCVVSKDNEEGEMIYALFDGYRVPQHVAKSKYRKTGKHYDIEKILEALKA